MKNNHSSGGRPRKGEERATHRSLERGLHTIEAVVATPGGASLAETARRIGLHRSTTHHLLQALVGMGYLSQDPHSRRYHPSPRLARLAGPISDVESLPEFVLPLLADMARHAGEEISLVIYGDGAAATVARRHPATAEGAMPDDDAPIALHATAAGKAILAWRPAPEQTALLDGLRLDRFTTNTLDSRAMLEAELRRIRAAGFAVDDEEYRDGVRGIAAPILDRTGSAVAAVCIVGPKDRITRQKIRDLRAPLGELTRQMSIRLGWRPD